MLVTQKCIYLRNGGRNGQNFGPNGYLQSLLVSFPKNYFPAIFGGHLEFPSKRQKCIYLNNGARFDEIFDPKVSAESAGDFPQKIVFLPLLAAILSFCVKRKKNKQLNIFIYENLAFWHKMVKHIKCRKIVISTKSLILIGMLCCCYAKTISFSLAKQYSSLQYIRFKYYVKNSTWLFNVYVYQLKVCAFGRYFFKLILFSMTQVILT